MVLEGISGFAKVFRGCMSDVPEGSKVVFAGSVGVCTPFISFLAYSVRDKGYDMVFLPMAEPGLAKAIVPVQNSGFFPLNIEGDPEEPDAIIILGGLAMEKFGVELRRIEQMIDEIGGREATLIGVGFGGIFERTGWAEALAFDKAMDSTMLSETS